MTGGCAVSDPNATRSTTAGITSATTASASMIAPFEADVRENRCIPCRTPPAKHDTPNTRSRLPRMLPVIDALTTSG